MSKRKFESELKAHNILDLRLAINILYAQETMWKGSKVSSLRAGFSLFYHGMDREKMKEVKSRRGEGCDQR